MSGSDQCFRKKCKIEYRNHVSGVSDDGIGYVGSFREGYTLGVMQIN